MSQKSRLRKKSRSPKSPKHPAVTWPSSLQLLQWAELLCAVIVTLLIITLHAYHAKSVGALWRDEVATVGAATMPTLSQVGSSLIYESYPILPYVIVRGWTSMGWLGDGDSSLRMLGALIGIGIIAVLWFSRRTLGYRAPILCLVFFGLNPIVIQWGDSIRGYGLGCLFILLAYGAVWQVVVQPNLARVSVAALMAVLSVQCLYQNAFLVFAICLAGCAVCIRRKLWGRAVVLLGLGVPAALSLLPYYSTIQKAQDLLIVNQESYPWSQVFNMFAFSLSEDSKVLLWAWVGCLGLSIVIGCWCVSSKWGNEVYDSRVDLTLYSVIIVAVGTVSFLAFMKGTKLPTAPWYYIVVMGLAALCMDVISAQVLHSFHPRVWRLVGALAVAGVTIPITWRLAPERYTNVDTVASVLTDRVSEGDYVIVSPYWYGITFQRYYRGKAAWTTIPPIQELRLNRFDLLKDEMAKEGSLQTVFEEAQERLQAGRRVWVVGRIEFPPEGERAPVLPPAPSDQYGWKMDYYLGAWVTQLGYFLQSHVLKGEPVPVQTSARISDKVEKVPLFVFEGWRP